MMNYEYYPEKKKKKNGQRRPRYWIPVSILLLLLMISGAGYYLLNQFSIEPPERQVFEVYADVYDGDNQPVIFDRLSIKTWTQDGAGGGFESKGNVYEHHIHGYSYHDMGVSDVGCVRGEVEIEGYAPYAFSYTVSNMAWGARVDIRVIADESISTLATVHAQDIEMPIFMAEPSITESCPF